MSVSEIASKYNVSTAWVRRLAMRGQLPGSKQVGKTWLIPVEAIETYLKNRPKPGPKPKQ